MWEFYYLLRVSKQDWLHVKGCACLEDHPERQFLGSAFSYRHAYQTASQRLGIRACICRLCVDDSMSEMWDITLSPPA
ncbi:hypothetical protein [Pantoea sp. At-9b]|jgi:hypothetical protein|uniref:hypothetical protein n=1 Tax=Pantoea sp. (strain At-9b) TaxID=592316 RepID=UPI0001B400E5|nr:hypothetical protein [Pantoea sp. At-9b]ADU72180.1 hypothetical protein Pat9b_4870 [Pantoea sp. At-9b]